MFIAAFQGGYKRPGTMNDLNLIIQRPGEWLRSLMQRFSQVAHNIPMAQDAALVSTFQRNVRDTCMMEKLGKHNCQTMKACELYALADKCTLMEEGRLGPELAAQAAAKPVNDDPAGKKKRKRCTRQVLSASPTTGVKPGSQPTVEVAAMKPTSRP